MSEQGKRNNQVNTNELITGIAVIGLMVTVFVLSFLKALNKI